MGTADRVVRTVLALTVGALIIAGELTGAPAIILGVLAGVLLLTSFAGSCLLYLPFGISTIKKK